MNAKFAKALRSAAGYRNRTATPSRAPFPGLSKRAYDMHVYDEHRREVIDVKTGKPKTQLVFATMPVKHDGGSPRHVYRRLKRRAKTDPAFVARIRAAMQGIAGASVSEFIDDVSFGSAMPAVRFE